MSVRFGKTLVITDCIDGLIDPSLMSLLRQDYSK